MSEFIRVTDTLLPERAFLRIVPELAHGGCTTAGIPVRPQLLGSDPVCLAENAASLASMGPHGIDLNFGCPAKIVNRHGGGAALLQEPETLHRIVAAVRRAVPGHLPVSAKMRLGFHDDTLALQCAQALAAGGASELVVHARTRADAYRPPAYWERVNDIRLGVSIPVLANGEIWTPADAHLCRSASGCHGLMLGRGIVADPGLALAIRHGTGTGTESGRSAIGPSMAWEQLIPLLGQFWSVVRAGLTRRQQAGRLKQWLNFLRRRYVPAQTAFLALRIVNDPLLITQWLQAQGAYPNSDSNPSRGSNRRLR